MDETQDLHFYPALSILQMILIGPLNDFSYVLSTEYFIYFLCNSTSSIFYLNFLFE